MTNLVPGAWSLALALTFTATVATAQETGDAAPALAAALSPDSHVRAVDREARRLLETAVACSPTVARMVVALQESDLVASIQARPLPKNVRGEVRLVAAAGQVRYARVSLGVPAAFPALLGVLGHELYHLTELASAPQVRDLASQAEHYRRIGYEKMRGGFFETDGALEAGRQVAGEVAGCKAAR